MRRSRARGETRRTYPNFPKGTLDEEKLVKVNKPSHHTKNNASFRPRYIPHITLDDCCLSVIVPESQNTAELKRVTAINVIASR